MHRCVMIVAIGSTFLVSLTARAAGPFVTPPGNLERATGGVAVAGRGSIASVWHNPAALTDASTGAAAGWANAPERDRGGDLEASGSTLFAGAAFINERKRYGKAGVGVAAYTPHTMTFSVARSGEADSAFGRVDWTSQAIGVPYAVELAEHDLSVGITGELIAVDPGGTDLRVEGPAGQIRSAEIDDGQAIGFSGALGARYGLWTTSVWEVSLAGRLHLPATSGAEVDADASEAELLLPAKPHGVAIGGRARRSMGSDSELAGQLQLGEREWGDSFTVTHWGVGIEWVTPFEGVASLESGSRRVHFGISGWSADEAKGWLDIPDGRILSAGIGFAFDNGVGVDLSLERRREDRDAFDSSSTWLVGVSASISY